MYFFAIFTSYTTGHRVSIFLTKIENMSDLDATVAQCFDLTAKCFDAGCVQIADTGREDAGAEFDDVVKWLSTNQLFSKMIEADQLP
jgi:hypothetical protein